MKFLLASFFDSSWFLVVVLVVAIGLLFLTSFSRRKKEEQYRQEISQKVVKGAKIKTLTGIYATVVSIRSTTDGKIVLIESGEGDKKSYQEIHIDAIYGIDESEEMVLDAEGNEVPLSEYNKAKAEALEQAKAEKEALEQTKEKKVEESKTEEIVEETKTEETKTEETKTEEK